MRAERVEQRTIDRVLNTVMFGDPEHRPSQSSSPALAETEEEPL
jgi:hypothetical protein